MKNELEIEKQHYDRIGTGTGAIDR